MGKTKETSEFDLSKTNWEIDPESPNCLRQKKNTVKNTGSGNVVVGVGGHIRWKSFPGKTDAEKMKNAIAMADGIDQIA